MISLCHAVTAASTSIKAEHDCRGDFKHLGDGEGGEGGADAGGHAAKARAGVRLRDQVAQALHAALHLSTLIAA